MYIVWMYMRFKKSSLCTYNPFYNKCIDYKNAIVFTQFLGFGKEWGGEFQTILCGTLGKCLTKCPFVVFKHVWLYIFLMK